MGLYRPSAVGLDGQPRTTVATISASQERERASATAMANPTERIPSMRSSRHACTGRIVRLVNRGQSRDVRLFSPGGEESLRNGFLSGQPRFNVASLGSHLKGSDSGLAVDVRLLGQNQPDKWIPQYAARYYWGDVLSAGARRSAERFHTERYADHIETLISR